MERQYIGARYVPKFFENPTTGDAEWMPGVPYEALTIVTYLGNSYTSKKAVPAGIGNPSSAPVYWIATGLYNAQVEAIRKGLVTANENISTLQTGHNEQQSQINTLITHDSFIEKNVSGIKKRIVCIGDSYNYDGAGWTGWGTSFKNRYPWFDVFVAANPGGGFVTVANERTFITELDEIYPNVTSPETITDVVVMGGYNDMSLSQTRDAIVTKMSEFKHKANELFPNAKIHVGFIGVDHRRNGKMSDCFIYADYYNYGCSVNGLTFIPNIQYTLLVSDYIFYETDNPNSGFHPTTAGSGEIARHLMTHLQGGIPDIYYSYTVATFTISLHNDKCFFEGNGALIPQIMAPSETVNNGEWVQHPQSFGDHIFWGKPASALLGAFATCKSFTRISDKSSELVNIKYYDGHFYFSQNVQETMDMTGLFGTLQFCVEANQMY